MAGNLESIEIFPGENGGHGVVESIRLCRTHSLNSGCGLSALPDL